MFLTSHFPVDHRPFGGLGFILCSAFAEEGECSRRIFHQMAETLASCGIPAVVPDLTGTGNSSGDMMHVSIAVWRDDLLTCAQYLRQEFKATRIGLLGLRFGCVLSLLVLTDTPDADVVVLWQPLLAPESHVATLLRNRLVRETIVWGNPSATRRRILAAARVDGCVDLEGYPISSGFLDELGALTWDSFSVPPRPLRIGLACQSAHDLPRKLHDRLAALIPRATLDHIATISGKPFWARLGVVETEPLIHATRNWINA
jgi:hypothetical protein